MGGREISRPYRVWFFAEGERFLSIWRCHRPHWGGRRWCCGMSDFKQMLESATPQHQRRPRWGGRWHRQKDKNRSPSAKNQTR